MNQTASYKAVVKRFYCTFPIVEKYSKAIFSFTHAVCFHWLSLLLVFVLHHFPGPIDSEPRGGGRFGAATFSVILHFTWLNQRDETTHLFKGWESVSYLSSLPSKDTKPRGRERLDNCDINRSSNRQHEKRGRTYKSVPCVFLAEYEWIMREQTGMKINGWLMAVRCERSHCLFGHVTRVKGWRRRPGGSQRWGP